MSENNQPNTFANKTRVKPDPIPNIRAAGKIIAFGTESADVCIRQDVHFKQEGPGTPESIKKYRKSFQN